MQKHSDHGSRKFGWTRTVLWIAATCVLAIAVFPLIQPLTIGRLARAQVKANPFTLQLESYEFTDVSSSGTLFARETVARRSDGATVHVDNMAGLVGLQAGETARHIYFLDGREFTVYDGVSSVVRFPQHSAETIAFEKARILNPPTNCVSPGSTLVSYGTLQGYKVAIVKVRNIGDHQLTVWYAPDLGCQKLQYRVEVQDSNGAWELASETKTVSLTAGEPDPALFEIPDSYASVAPSEALRKEADRLGIDWTSDLQQEAARRDAAYNGHALMKTVPAKQ